MRRSVILAGLVWTAVWAASPHVPPNPSFVLIVNRQNPVNSLSPGKLKVIFLRQISRWPWGAEMNPVDLPDSSALRQEFVRAVLKTNIQELNVYWIDQKATRNIDRPAVARGVEEVKTFVAGHTGAIGYIPAAVLDGSVKQLELSQ